MNSRYNSFNQVHKGLRAMLYEAALQLQQSNLAKKEEGERAITALEEVLVLFESHAHNEDHFFNEPLEKTNPAVATMFEKEHEEDHRLGKVLADLIEQWRNDATPAAREITGRNLFYAFNEFIAFNLYHMNKEEIELNGALWKVYSDPEIKAIEQTIVQQTPPEKMMKYAKWMIRGINDAELAKWFAEVKAFAPQPVYDMLTGIAARELEENRWRQIQSEVEHQKNPTVV
jgi:hypothetical protein